LSDIAVENKPLSDNECWLKAYQEMIWEVGQILRRCNQVHQQHQKCSDQSRPKIIILIDEIYKNSTAIFLGYISCSLNSDDTMK